MSWKDDARRRLKESKQGARYKLAEGENTFRLLPSKDGPEAPPYIETRTHYNLGPDETMSRCGKDANGEGECWLCDVKIPELSKSASQQKRKMAAKLNARNALTVQVSPVEDGKFGAPKAWTMDIGGARAASTIVLSLLSSSKRSYEDPIKGYNVTLERTGAGLKTTYGTPAADDAPSKVPASILAQIKGFDELVFEYSEKDQQAAYFGKPRPGRGEAEEEEEPEDGEEPEDTEDGEEGEEELPEEGAEGEEGEAEEEAESDPEDEYEEAEETEPEDEPEPAPPPRRSKPAPTPVKKPPLTVVKKPASMVRKPAPAPVKKPVRR